MESGNLGMLHGRIGSSFVLNGLEIYKDKKILVTGHTGFKGTWLTAVLRLAGAEVHGLSLPPEDNSLYTRVKRQVCSETFLDIRDRKLVGEYFAVNSFDGVFHLAAQPLVRRSYQQPVETFDTNVMGTAHVLESITKYKATNWVIVVTTDKVYEYNHEQIAYNENSKLGGSDPYSGSKAAVEHLLASWRSVISYEKSNLQLCSVRAGNVVGGGDHATDRLLPDIVRGFLHGEKISIRNPSFVRPWQHVLDPLNGYLILGKELFLGNSVSDSYNFGHSESSNLTVEEIAKIAKEFWPNNLGFVAKADTSSMHEVPFLWLSSERARTELGWGNKYEAEEAVQLTLNWEIEARDQHPDSILETQIKTFFGEAS
jgi:CDP-glucose 4,6-dehydratase